MNALHTSTFTKECYVISLSTWDTARLDREAVDKTFNDTGRKDRGGERQTDSSFELHRGEPKVLSVSTQTAPPPLGYDKGNEFLGPTGT